MTEKTMFTMEACVPGECACSPRPRVCRAAGKSVRQIQGAGVPAPLLRATASLNNLGSFHAISLADGERVRWNRSDVLGILKPELLPDEARLHLSQIRPDGALDPRQHTPKYSGYSFLPDGRYTSGVLLCNEQEAVDYIEMQKDYQHRVMVCDSDDFCVFEMVEGKLIHPSPEALEQLRGERREQSGGMELKL
jgi:hypothetical protein